MEAREKDIQTLANAVLYLRPDCWDNPNGAYETVCPLCGIKERRGGNPLNDNVYASMSELNHKPDCPYLIAKDLSTNFK